MATTIVPDPGKPRPEVTVQEILDLVHSWRVTSQADEDKASDIEDSRYYSGQLSICEELELFITKGFLGGEKGQE